LSHYYEGRRRPLSAYAFGMIDRWARMASQTPWLANALGNAPVLRQILGKALHLAPQRSLPRFASRTFRNLAHRQGVAGLGIGANADPKKQVVLWADTFNNYFHPETCEAALEVLTDAGFQVRVSRQHLCCGRPLYDFGMLDRAKAYLKQVLDALAAEIEAVI